MRTKYQFIAIEGNIGAGKTTLAKKISEQFNARLLLEQFADNPFLPKFYANPDRYSFPLELSFLAERYSQLQNEMGDRELFSEFLLSDYYFMKSLIFAHNTLGRDEYDLYKKMFNIIYPSFPKPDLYVYLHQPIDKLLANITKRGREYEKSISADYLKSVQDGYFKYFQQYENQYRFLIIDTSNIDFVAHDDDYKLLVDVLFNREYNLGINRIIV